MRRRDFVRLGVGALFAGSGHARSTARQGASIDERKWAVSQRFPAVELQAARSALLALERGIDGYATVGVGRSISLVWVRAADQIWAIGVDERDLQFKFDVFPLAIETFEAVRARVAAWKPPTLPADISEGLRHLMSMRPEPVKSPTDFRPWPLSAWRVEVLRRAEYIIDNVDPGPTLGDDPSAQGAARPGRVPATASASCEVAVALLFTGDGGKRLLIGADWMPLNMIVTEEAGEIDQYLAPCDRVSAGDYAARLSIAG